MAKLPGSMFLSIPRMELPPPTQHRPNSLNFIGGMAHPHAKSPWTSPGVPSQNFAVNNRRPANFGGGNHLASPNFPAADLLSPVSVPAVSIRCKRILEEEDAFKLASHKKDQDVSTKFRKMGTEVLDEAESGLVERDGYLWCDDGGSENYPNIDFEDNTAFQKNGCQQQLFPEQNFNTAEMQQQHEWLITSFSSSSGFDTPMSMDCGETPTTPGGSFLRARRRAGTPLTPATSLAVEFSTFGFPSFPPSSEMVCRRQPEERWD